jgi:hypothetical protein
MFIAGSNSDWKSFYDAAVFETDPSKVTERIATARSAILNHIEESIRNPAVGEHCAMDAALRNLRRLAKNLDSLKGSQTPTPLLGDFHFDRGRLAPVPK